MTSAPALATPTVWRQYYALTKPRVVQLIVFCALIGMVPVSYTHLTLPTKRIV